MADLEDVTLDGRPLQSLRVADLKAALEERGLSKSGQKNALIKRLKGALMLENLQRTSTAHVGLQPNSQIGEEMSQNSFIKQYLAKQQELLRQRLEREAREAYETSDQEEHNEVNNSTCPPQPQDASPAVTDHFKPPGPSSGQAMPEGLSHRNQEAAMSRPPASGSVAQDRSEAAADSDEEESEDGEDDADDDDDWDSNIQRRLPRQPVRAPVARERSAASCQPQQQHIPSLLSPQLRQPTPPPSPPPELSFPLPDTPKQSPPSPDVAPAGQSPSSSSSGSSSSGSRSSSPEPHSGHTERKPGPLTLLARKMESEGAFSGAGWHGRDANRQDNCSSSITFPGRVHPEGLVSPIPHTLTAGHAPIKLGTNQSHAQVPVSVLKPTADRDAELEREKALELQRQEQQRKLEQERAMEEERVRAALEREEKQRALEKEQLEREQALEREKTLQMERELALERERALAKEREERERALELERQKELERQRALEKELALQREREEREQREREEQERAMERERALEQEKLERERALEAERMERERIERENALEQERLERERLERERLEREAALERERLEKEKALEKERMEREEQERIEQERIEREKALERERIVQERIEREKALERERIEEEKALERERIEQERIEREKALERERIEQERIEQEKALERERIEREKALERERIEREKALERERIEREKALERERIEREKALERERIEREKALERERIEREKALERERIEKERIEREKALEQRRIEQEKALERERLELLERERALEQQRLELEEKEKIKREQALEQERIQREKAIEHEKEKAEREAALERERLEKEKAEQERLNWEKAQEQERLERERELEEERKAKERALELEKQRLVEHDSLEKGKAVQKENTAHERALADESRMAEVESEAHLPPRRGCEIGFIPLPTPPPLSTGPSRKTSTEADKQEGEVHGPVSCDEGQAEESETPKSPQSPFKKFRLLRDTPLQPQAASIVIKRPRTFSDTPQPCVSVMSVINAEGHQQKRQSADLEDFAGQLTSDDAVESAKNEGARNLVSEAKEEFEKTEAAVKESIQKAADDEDACPSSPVGATVRGRDVKKTEKKDTQRSSSNDSSSSESDSDSSTSHSSDSSSREKTYTSQQRRDESPERDASPQLVEVSKEHLKTSPSKMEISTKNVYINEGVPTKTQLNEAPTRDDEQRRKSGKDEEERPEKTRQGVESAMSEPEKDSEASEETPKAFSARKISLSSSKSSPGSTENELESGSAGGRKRRWGSSTAVTAKKPSISITTDSLKSLIPDIRPALNQEAVVDLHPEEPVLSETEDEDKDRADQELQIRRTVTQVVNVENQENGQKEAKRWQEESEEDDMQGERETKTYEENMDTHPRAMETPSPLHTRHEAEINTVTPSTTVIRRSISQQKTGVSITIDDPVRTARQPSPPRGKVSNIVHVCNLVRPFTLGQLKELLSRTGTLVEDGFWIDKIKSHCYVTYSSSEEAVATRAALHGVKWPQSNPKFLCVDFCQQDELDFHKGLGSGERPGTEEQSHGRGLPSLVPERDQWAEREREMERRERARAEREWDRDKVREFGKPGEEKEAGARRSRSRERRRKERGKSKEKKTEKKEKAAEDPPAKLLDDLFRKTKAAPCIYWLPLTEEQFLQREAARAERRKEREKQRKKEEEEEELKKREEENKERMKVGGCITGDRSENEKDKVRDRDRDRDRGRDRGRDREREREADKRRDGYRRPGGNAAPSGRRSRSRSDPRERRR